MEIIDFEYKIQPEKWFKCKRKVRYGREKTAQNALAQMSKKGVTGLEAYLCKYCEGFHLGHAWSRGRVERLIIAIKKKD